MVGTRGEIKNFRTVQKSYKRGKMKTFKLLLFMIVTISSADACGPGNYYSDFEKENFYNFLPAPLDDFDNENPLFWVVSGSHIYAHDAYVTYSETIQKKLNIQEWQAYFKNRLSRKEVEDLIYNEKIPSAKRYAKYRQKIQNKAFKNYLLTIAEIGERVELLEVQDKFLRLRYLLLAMRANFYEKQYKESLLLYNKVYPSVSSVKSIVVEWIDALRAGALQHLGKNFESNQLYAKVLSHKSNAYLGYHDFKIKNNTEWDALLATAKSANEKARYHFLRALKSDGSMVLEHKAIATIAPKSVWFERLTYMLMQDFQVGNFAYETSENKENKYVQTSHEIYSLKEKQFLETMRTLKEPSFLDVYTQTYLKFLASGKLEVEKVAWLKNKATPKEKPFVEILAYLDEVIHVTKSKQKSLFKHLKRLSSHVNSELKDSLFRYTALHNRAVYPKMSAKRLYSKVFADNTRYSEWFVSRDAILADSFEAYVEEKNRNYYEQNLFKRSMKILAKNDVAKTLALLNIKDGNFKKAQKYLDQVPQMNRESEYNPFNVSISGLNRKKIGTKKYTQRAFVETMLKIEASLKKNPKSAMDYFLHATGRYNTSWFGNSPMFGTIWKTSKGIETEQAHHIRHNFKTILKEYELALKYAKKEEFKAKIAYQILKVKMNQEVLIAYNHDIGSVYISDEKRRSLKINVKKSSLLVNAFSEYKRVYEKTKYGQEIIASCATFGFF